MKIRVTLKDPDTMHDAVDEAMRKAEKPDGIYENEWRQIQEDRAGAIKDAISRKWMEYGYLVVEFEVGDDFEATSATVLPNE